MSQIELSGKMKKFLQSLDDAIFKQLEKEAKKKGIKVQELIRSIIIPDWLTKKKSGE